MSNRGKPTADKKTAAKGQRAKRLKEEAERRAREEEEARILAEQEEAERKERELIAAKELRRLEADERSRRKGELGELDAILVNNYNHIYSAKLEARRAAKWARYMRCDGSPDPSNLGEINMHLTLWKEDTINTEFEAILKETRLLLQLIQELENLLNDEMDDELNNDKRVQYKETILAMQELLMMKLDLGSHDLMLKASSLAPPDNNLTKIIGDDDITLCLWANLTKNPRLKSFDFDSRGMVFELNSFLNRADCSVRALFTRFDHLSHLSKSFYPRLQTKSSEFPPKELENPVTDDVTQDDLESALVESSLDIKIHKNAGHSPENAGHQPHEGSDFEEEVTEKGAEEKLEKLDTDADSEDIEDDEKNSTPVPVDYEDFDGDEDVVDLRGFHVVGGIFHINLCELPPQPKYINKWTITLLVDPPELHHINYVAEKEQKLEENSVEGDSTNKEPVKEREKKEKDLEKTPIAVTLRLPEDVCFCEEPLVARWDSGERVWRTDGFLDKVYNENGRQLTFRICKFGTMALLQDSQINMPFQSWELRPRTTNHVQLTIIAAILEVEIQIKDDRVCLSQPENRPELAHLLNNWMSIGDFVKKMCASGVNIFPAEDSFKYVKIPDKNSLTETRLYRQMSLVCSAMAFSWSRWNSDVNDREKVIVQGAQHLSDEPLLEEDWSLFQMTKRRAIKLKMTEYSEAFSEENAEGTEFHADLYHLAESVVSETAKERIRETTAMFSETVYDILRLTRVVLYS